MKKELPVAVQREILRLERRVFQLEKQLDRQKVRYEERLAELKAENHKLRTTPMFMTVERQKELQERRGVALRGTILLPLDDPTI
jgi:hypothetical protein